MANSSKKTVRSTADWNWSFFYLLNNSSSSSYAVLFCTDLELDAYSIYIYYKSRFQIEFLFRDSKQFTGLAQSHSAQIVVFDDWNALRSRQARDLTKLDFHFNASICMVTSSSAAFSRVISLVFKYLSTKRIAKENLSSSLMTALKKERRKLPSSSNKVSTKPICSGGNAFGGAIASIREPRCS